MFFVLFCLLCCYSKIDYTIFESVYQILWNIVFVLSKIPFCVTMYSIPTSCTSPKSASSPNPLASFFNNIFWIVDSIRIS